ncbi:MAG: PLP-dependent aspartate aminotransferase family protein [Candidatus Binatia bacterium]
MEKKSRRSKKDGYRMRTQMIHGVPDSTRWDYDHHVVPPISASTTFRLNSAYRGARGFANFANEAANLTTQVPIYIYDRLDEPTRGMLEDALTHAEGGESTVCFATGMAAISAALGVTVKSGEEIIAHRVVYGCTYSLLTTWFPRNQITTHFIDLTNEQALRNAITERTRVVYFETPVNPTLQLIDITAVRRIVDETNKGRQNPILVIVDNTFATPYCQRPLEQGAHLVVHSLTKDIGGFGTDMGGAVITPREFYSPLLLYRKDFGGVLSPKSAWAFLVYGLPTLATRMVNQQKSALKVAQFLEQHPLIAKIAYPGLEHFPQRELATRQMTDYRGKFAPGSMLSFTLRDPSNDNRVAEAFIDYIAEHAYSITLAVSLGHTKTLIENPYSMTHATLPPAEKLARGVEPGLLRLSLGLEDWQDIIEDLSNALDAVSELCKAKPVTPLAATR